MIDIKAILHTWPGAEVSVYGDEVTWHSMAAPSDADLQSALDAYAAHVTATAYKDDRQVEYPPIGDFADAYYWAQKGDDSKMAEYIVACDKVKSDHPKPE